MERKEREAAIKKETSRRRRVERDEAARAARDPANLRCAISCIMGHVDTGTMGVCGRRVAASVYSQP